MFTAMMQGYLSKYSVCYEPLLLANNTFSDDMDDVAVKKVHWSKWLKTAMVYKLRIVNWPKGVKPPGPGFDPKNLSTPALHRLVQGFVEHKTNGIPLDNVPKLERWTAGTLCQGPALSCDQSNV
jgi:hypothetical protein